MLGVSPGTCADYRRLRIPWRGETYTGLYDPRTVGPERMLRCPFLGAEALLMARTWTYRDWSTALCGHYFSAENVGTPVLFLVDDDHLATIHPSRSPTEAAGNLAAAVRGRIAFGHPDGEFHRIEKEARVWRLGDAAANGPPFLPLLGICVLAASRMGSGVVNPVNYRAHFCGLLDLPTTRLPYGYGTSVPQLWKYLDEWLEVVHGGSRGRSTIIESASQPWIGYALSQTLFLSADVSRLADFFDSIEFAPGEDVEGPEMLAYFRAWAPGRGLSKGAQFMMESADHAVGLERILMGHAARWDGTRVPGSGERRASIRVVVHAPPRTRVTLAAARGEGLPASAEVLTPDGRHASLISGPSGWYESIPLAVDSRMLRRGASLRGDGFSLVLPGAAVYVLRLDPDVGGWGSVPGVLVGQRHWVLLADDVWEQASRWLFDHSGGACREEEHFRGALPGWRLLRDVVIDRPPSRPAPADSSSLAPSMHHRVELEGGLPLDRGTRTYLVGGPPDLWRPELDDQIIPARLISNGQMRDLPGDSLHLRLADLEPSLAHGEHVVEALGALRRSLRLVPSARLKPPMTDRLEHRLATTANGRVESHRPPAGDPAQPGETRVSGALVFGGDAMATRPQPVLVNRRARYAVVLGSRPGEREGVSSLSAAPSWMSDFGLSDRFGDFSPAFDPVWVIETWADPPRYRARAVSGQSPGVALDEREAVEAWAEEFAGAVSVRDRDVLLWQQYVAVAEEIGE